MHDQDQLKLPDEQTYYFCYLLLGSCCNNDKPVTITTNVL